MTGIASQWKAQHPLLPTSRLGWGSLWSFVLLLASFAVMNVMVALGERGGETFLDNLALSIPAAVGFLGAAASMVSGIGATTRSHDRSVATGASAVASTLVFLFVVLSLVFG